MSLEYLEKDTLWIFELETGQTRKLNYWFFFHNTCIHNNHTWKPESEFGRHRLSAYCQIWTLGCSNFNWNENTPMHTRKTYISELVFHSPALSCLPFQTCPLLSARLSCTISLLRPGHLGLYIDCQASPEPCHRSADLIYPEESSRNNTYNYKNVGIG